jgi:hypothetical protein
LVSLRPTSLLGADASHCGGWPSARGKSGAG